MIVKEKEVFYKSVPDGAYFYGMTVIVEGRFQLLMWNDLLGVEGTDTEVKMIFRLYDVTIRGSGLLQLFRDAKRHKIDVLTATPRHVSMMGGEGMVIESIQVKEVQA